MNDNLVQLKIELDFSAYKVLNHVRIHNETIEKQIAAGIEKAITELTQENNFVDIVCNQAKKDFLLVTNKSIASWQLQNKLQNLIEEKISKQLEEYADKVAEQLIKIMKK
jgi:hypothetical protein